MGRCEPRIVICDAQESSDDAVRSLIETWLVPQLVEAFLRTIQGAAGIPATCEQGFSANDAVPTKQAVLRPIKALDRGGQQEL